MDKPDKRSLRFGMRLIKPKQAKQKTSGTIRDRCPNCQGRLIEGNLCLTCKERVQSGDLYELAKATVEEIKLDADQVNKLTSEYQYKSKQRIDLKATAIDVWESIKRKARDIFIIVVFLAVVVLAAYTGIYLQKVLY